HTVRRRKEHDIAARERFRVRRAKREVDVAAQALEHRANRRAGFLARGDGAQLGLRVVRKQPQELDSRISGPAYDANLDRHSPAPETRKPPEGGFRSMKRKSLTFGELLAPPGFMQSHFL